MEYKNRRTSLEQYAKMKNTKVLYNNEYDLENYLKGALAAEERCRFCYETRLNETAKSASELGFDAFTTTLLISPFQKHEMLVQVGEKAADEHGVEFYYEDFRVGYRKSREISKDMGLYMQKYCGCIFSEKERYLKPDTHKLKS
jgi:predicted adenine nucleotide alpha hydrolase (AANH) superfamily ATPase